MTEGETMPKLRVHNMSMSLDGYAAGPDQSVENPLGVRGHELHEWAFDTPSGRWLVGQDDSEKGVDDDMWRRGDAGFGATIMGRNMFGPVRGTWGDSDWTGWWGDDPPYHHEVFVLTHHPHPPIPMQGGTTFNFVTDGIESALDQAFEAAGGRDVRLGGGASAVRQYLRAGLIDDLHVAVVPILLGGGERLFDDVGDAPEGYTCTELASSDRVAHVVLSRNR